MQPLSAIDAISPALAHTSRLLLPLRNWRTLLKLCVVAFFAQMGGCNLNFSSPGRLPHNSSTHLSPAFAAGMLLFGLVALFIGLVLFYIGSRLQFVLFEVVLRQDTRIAPIWARYRHIVWRWIGLKIVFFVVALLCMTPLLVPLILHFIHSMPQGAETPANPAAFIATIFSFIAAIFIVVILLSVCYILIADFGLPSLALENTPIPETLNRILRFVRQEPGQIALYVLMRFLLALAWAVASYMAILLTTLILLVPLGGLAFALYVALHHGGPGAYALMICGWVILGVILAAVIVLAFILCFGACFTFIQAYAIFFLAGRYPLLAGILAPDPTQPFTPPPVFPSPEEKSDDTDPPFPMDPALA